MIMEDTLFGDKSSIKIESVPEYVTCPKCGGEIGLWTESILTICWFCGFHVFKKETIIN
jgi:Zn finger protein HypA/HybF involved in hydrogenase expression